MHHLLIAAVSSPGIPSFRTTSQTYGPTEATVIATYKECAPDVKRVSIGRPLPNYKCYVVDQHMQPVPPGAVGELVVGGISVSRNGYLNLPQKTASVFLHDTFTNMSYPLYRTGDLVRYGPSGDIEYFGRADFQVKIRGYRVELSEIETVIAEYPGIKSVVVDLQSYQGVKSLVAFITTTQENFNTEDIFPTLKGRLPVFMVPATIQILEELPTLTSGKVERRRLPNALEMQVKKRIVSKRPWAAVVSGMSTTERLGEWLLLSACQMKHEYLLYYTFTRCSPCLSCCSCGSMEGGTW